MNGFDAFPIFKSGKVWPHDGLTAKLKEELGGSGLCHISQQGQGAHDFWLAIHAALVKVLLQHAASRSTPACQHLQASARKKWADITYTRSSAGLAMDTGSKLQKTSSTMLNSRGSWGIWGTVPCKAYRQRKANGTSPAVWRQAMGVVDILTQAACVLCC